MTMLNDNERPVSIGIDAAVVADHQIAFRGPGVREDFRSTDAGGDGEVDRTAQPYAGSLVVVEPTAGIVAAVDRWRSTEAGCRIGFVQNRDSARLRQAISGRTKTDAVDADMLARCEAVLGVTALRSPHRTVGLRRALRRRHHMTVDAHRAECRLWSLDLGDPDVWRACGGHPVAQPLLGRWPDLRALGRARLSSITESSPPTIATGIRPDERTNQEAAQGWPSSGSADSISTTCVGDRRDLRRHRHRRSTPTRSHRPRPRTVAASLAHDVLTSIPGVGPICASTTRAWWGNGQHLRSAKAAGAFVGLNPSNWESGLSAAPSDDHQGGARRAAARLLPGRQHRSPPRPPTRRPLPAADAHAVHPHPANCAIARKLAARTWAVLQTGQPYEHRDLDDNPIDETTATQLALEPAVPADERRRNRATNPRRGRLELR